MAGRREKILGIPFFNGTAAEAVALASAGGLIVAPSGTCFERFLEDAEYRRAILTADVVLPDSGLMVTLWRLLRGRSVNRISGLAYLKQLLEEMRVVRNAVWILPNEQSLRKFLAWSGGAGFRVEAKNFYVAPIYGPEVGDDKLLTVLETERPQHIIIGIGAGAQEKLGWYLRENASYRPAIHCIGGALGFITGDQVAIPDWADQIYLGWFLRFLSQPRAFLPRLLKARVLPWLIVKYGEGLPPTRERSSPIS